MYQQHVVHPVEYYMPVAHRRRRGWSRRKWKFPIGTRPNSFEESSSAFNNHTRASREVEGEVGASTVLGFTYNYYYKIFSLIIIIC